MKSTITKATPFVDAAGKVTKWEFEVTCSKDDYERVFSPSAECDASKTPGQFKLADLEELARLDHWDNVFSSMYESTHSTAAPVETKVEDFDISKLS